MNQEFQGDVYIYIDMIWYVYADILCIFQTCTNWQRPLLFSQRFSLEFGFRSGIGRFSQSSATSCVTMMKLGKLHVTWGFEVAKLSDSGLGNTQTPTHTQTVLYIHHLSPVYESTYTLLLCFCHLEPFLSFFQPIWCFLQHFRKENGNPEH